MGGAHIIPIYGAKGYESRYLDYLSPQWMEMLAFTVAEARQLGLDIDMTTGSGWCFGGPHVSDAEANASVVVKQYDWKGGEAFPAGIPREGLQALAAVLPDGRVRDLPAGGALPTVPEGETWRLYAVSQKPSGQKVKRAGPGGQGHMLNLFYPEAMRDYLRSFEAAFANYQGPKPRAMYHDSYEYRSDWCPDLFAHFQRLRGYRLQEFLPEMFSNQNSDRAARIKSDYRETLSDLMVEQTLPLWTEWCRRNGFLTRNEAHGSPGNWLDLYALADIPETEMFFKDRNKLISKFASAAAHVAGKPLVSSETGTWLNEHFTETLADMKYLLDDLFLSGVNHVLYHGACFSPEDAPWPGWLFYASYEMNPRNPIWRDAPALNQYAARCQSVLQAGRADNDLLLYWPIHDLWHSSTGLSRNLTVHARDWFEDQPMGRAAGWLWEKGYAFDYVSDRQLRGARFRDGRIELPGGSYAAIMIPETRLVPLETFVKLLDLAQAGASVIFEGQLPRDVPGLGQLETRREQFQVLSQRIKPETTGPSLSIATAGKGRVLIGSLREVLEAAAVVRETLFDQPGLMCLRRKIGEDIHYFIANRSETNSIHGWVPLAKPGKAMLIMDPLSGRTGLAQVRGQGSANSILLDLPVGGSVIIKCADHGPDEVASWEHWDESGTTREIAGPWRIEFLGGGPALPAAAKIPKPQSWAELPDERAQSFAGSASYQVRFDSPDPQIRHWRLALGRVCQSARVKLNGRDLGTLWTSPFQIELADLKPAANLLEIEVTSTAANRIRDLDRRKVNWKNFQDINFVNINYKPFDASQWPLAEAGLLGPVTLTPLRKR